VVCDVGVYKNYIKKLNQHCELQFCTKISIFIEVHFQNE
jgi:hypothetical protein